MKNKNLSFMTQAAMIAAIYVVLTIVFAIGAVTLLGALVPLP